jgi:hypothetical protein
LASYAGRGVRRDTVSTAPNQATEGRTPRRCASRRSTVTERDRLIGVPVSSHSSWDRSACGAPRHGRGGRGGRRGGRQGSWACGGDLPGGPARPAVGVLLDSKVDPGFFLLASPAPDSRSTPCFRLRSCWSTQGRSQVQPSNRRGAAISAPHLASCAQLDIDGGMRIPGRQASPCSLSWTGDGT